MKFDIQKFANDAVENEISTQESNNTADKISIPEELSDISEDIAREVMEQHAEQNSELVQEKDEFDAEGNYTGEKNVADVKIDYARYKETLDKQKDFEKQLAAYREKFGDINSQSALQQNFQPQLPEQNYQPQENSVPEPAKPRYFSTEDVEQINNAVNQIAMQWTGLTQEDVEGLDYLDDDDPKISIWNHARKIAEIATYNQIVAQQQAQEQEYARRSMLLQQSQSDFDNFVNQQRAAENFAALQNFAATEFYKSLSPGYQRMIFAANQRLENHNATADDFVLVQDFFDRAVTAFKAKQARKDPTATPRKSAPQPQFPRTDKVNGTVGSGGGITNSSLAEMVKSTSWDKIPQQYKDILLNATT